MAEFGQLIGYIQHFEGGISSDPEDKASRNPSPIVDDVDDIRMSRYKGHKIHTNKGVTWTAYAGWCAISHKTPTEEEFREMPDAVWLSINRVYWDQVRGKEIRSQAVANHMCDFAWGSGAGEAIREAQYVLQIVYARTEITVDGVLGPKTLAALNELPERKLFEQLHARRRGLLDYWSRPGVADAKYHVGWLRRADYFFAWQMKANGWN